MTATEASTRDQLMEFLDSEALQFAVHIYVELQALSTPHLKAVRSSDPIHLQKRVATSAAASSPDYETISPQTLHYL